MNQTTKLAQTQTPFPDEVRHLEETNHLLDEALAEAESTVDKLDRDYNEAKRYMAQNRGEIDPHEMFQNELGLRDIDHSGAFAVEVRDRMAKLKASPYFARIDFAEDGEAEADPYYIGQFSFRHHHELVVYDWRAPISSMFYDCEVGPASFTAPAGEVHGKLTRKRQFKITSGQLEYALETSAHIGDEVLQRELSLNADEKMKSIVSTIQKEQNQVIRNEKAGTLIIQGVAGSGKTSIALHRVAYLLYRFKEKLRAQNITILSPNRVFGDYISRVLPELGEEPIFEISFADIAEVQLEGVMAYEREKDPLEAADEAWVHRARHKSTLAFKTQLDEYIEDMYRTVFVPADYIFEPFRVPAAWIKSRYDAYEKHPVLRRLEMVAEDICDRLTGDNVREAELPRQRAVLKSLKAMLTAKNTLALYKAFYKQAGGPHLFCPAGKNRLEWNDVFPFLYLHAAFAGLRESPIIRHIVIDEMQDYTPVQYGVINRLFRCQKTILGDFGQQVNPTHLGTLDVLHAVYPHAQFITLRKSYRSTWEIIQFAKGIQNDPTLEAVERHGPVPSVVGYTSPEEELAQIRSTVQSIAKSGDASMGIIAKTNAAAYALYEALQKDTEVHLISPESRQYQGGVSVVSVGMSKGLEFDEVLVTGADSGAYHTEADRGLLYVACTRAMHRLTVTHTGAPSRFIWRQKRGR